jgi:diphthine-ammonia ligase
MISITMSKSMKVIALISGGKDSLYSILHCIQNGHNVIALANLYPTPPEGAKDALETADLNSFMYQTVGHSVIPLYADALQLPLYRQEIRGTSIQTGRDYDPSLNASCPDETEDLLLLLETVKQNHPEADALCSGAILSTYQRTRIESVALRLGLTSLAYLWQYPFLPPPLARQDSLTGLLEDMNAAGCESLIIKVASGGMPEYLLGLNVADVRTRKRMVANLTPFYEDDESALRGAILGEGGEFETLAINGPPSVWKKKIEITERDQLVVSEEGGVNWLKLGQPRAVQQGEYKKDKSSIDLVRVPSPFDPQFEYVAAAHLKVEESSKDVPQGTIDVLTGTLLSYNVFESVTIMVALESDALTIGNITAPTVCGNAAQQMEHIVSSLKEVLLHISKANSIHPPVSSASIISTTLLLGSMSSFPSVNTQYAQIFPINLPNPPARVTIACPLPPKILVSLSCTISLLPRSVFRGLHVQSRSYWAPANIGPYSQAVCVPFDPDHEEGCEFVYVAGQIPLVPASMEVLQAPFADQAVLALQHLWRVGQERHVDLWVWGVAYLPRLDGVQLNAQPGIAAMVWEQAHLTTVQGTPVLSEVEDGEEEDDSGPDAWDLQYGRMKTGHTAPTVGKHRHVLSNGAVIVDERDRLWIPPLIVAEVEELPRSTPIEWHSHGLGHLLQSSGKKAGVDVNFFEFPWGSVSVCSYRTYSSRDDADEEPPMSRGKRRNHHFVTIQVSQAAMVGVGTELPSLAEVLNRVLTAKSSSRSNTDDALQGEDQASGTGDRFSLIHGVAYITGVHGKEIFTGPGGVGSLIGITVIPCRRLWGNGYQRDVPSQKEGGVMDLTVALTLRVDTFPESSQ